VGCGFAVFPAFCPMRARLFCPHGEELRETSLKRKQEINMPQQNVNTPASESKESSFENTSDNVRFFSRLHVRDTQGNYVMATDSQILAEAALAIDYRYPTGTVF
jgi:hypothetical protein